MEYSVRNSHVTKLIITKNPYAWFEADEFEVAQIIAKLEANDDHTVSLLKKKEETLEFIGRQHLVRNPIITLTNRCNLNCTHCYVDSNAAMRKSIQDITYRNFTHFMEFIISKGKELGGNPVSVQLFGGEPTIHRDFVRIVEYIRSKKILVRVSTNCVSKNFSSGKLDHLYEDRGIEWRVSLESCRKKVHDAVRPRSYDKVINNLRHLVSRDAFISIKTVIGDHNVHHLEDIIVFSKNIGASFFTYGLLGTIGVAEKNNLSTSLDEFSITKKIHNIVKNNENLIQFLRGTPFFVRWLSYMAQRSRFFPVYNMFYSQTDPSFQQIKWRLLIR